MAPLLLVGWLVGSVPSDLTPPHHAWCRTFSGGLGMGIGVERSFLLETQHLDLCWRLCNSESWARTHGCLEC